MPGLHHIDAESVAALAKAAGFDIAAERLEEVAERLRELHEQAAALSAVDLEGVAPDTTYDPTWPAAE